MNKKILVILFIIIISISACSGSSNVNFNPNNGATIEDASFDIKEVYDDEETSLLFDVVNVGGKDIPNGVVNVYIYGPQIDPATSANTEVWRLTGSSPAGIAAANGYISTTVDSLPPPDTTLGTPGGRRSIELTFDPADVLDGVSVPTTFHVQACYPYTTSTTTQVEVSSKNEFRATGTRSSKKDTINAGGPIQVELQGEGSIRSGGAAFVLPLVFKVTDVAGGFSTLNTEACGVDKATTLRNRVNVEVSIDGITANIDCGSGTNKAEVKLRDGVGTLFCSYTPAAAANTPIRTYMVSAEATYMYYMISEISVTNTGSSL